MPEANMLTPDELEPDNSVDNAEDGIEAIKPKSTEEAYQVLRSLYATIKEAKQKRTEANEVIAAEREKAVTLGVSKKAQAAVESYMRLNDSDRMYFDEAVAVYRTALGSPMQQSLSLVHSDNE